MKHVARAAGVSVMTVSLALRQDLRIPEVTRLRILKIAERIGYRKNPLVAILMTNMRGLHPRGQDAHVIAYVESVSSGTLPQALATLGRFRSGARMTAEANGFQMECFQLGLEGVSELRLLQILKARGIRGVVFAPSTASHMELSEQWEQHALASIGFSLRQPMVHRAVNHHAHSVRLAASELAGLGYRRIGLVLDPNENERTESSWLSTFLLLKHETRTRGHSFPLLITDVGEGRLKSWLLRERPDCVISADSRVIAILRECQPPGGKPVGFASLHLNASCAGCSGIDQNNERVGGAAVELVVEQLHANHYGVPTDPKTVLIEGRWVAGSSAPGVSPSARAALKNPA